MQSAICQGCTIDLGLDVNFSKISQAITSYNYLLKWLMIILRKQWCTVYNSKISLYNPCFCQSISRPTAVQGYQGTITKVPRLFKVPCEFPWSWLCSLKCYDLFVATDNICAQRGTALNYECRVQVTNFQIFSFVYHFIRLWREILHYSTAVTMCRIICQISLDKNGKQKWLSENN